jgi:hypothetical protein
MSAEEAFTKLKKPLAETYSNVTEFDKALFQSLRDCLSTYEVRQQDDDSVIFLGATQEYAVGIARRKSPALSFMQNKMLPETTVQKYDTTDDMDIEATPNHAVCLFRKGNDKWAATDCFSVAELQMSDSSCADLEYGTIDEPELWGKHAALAHAILNNMDCVLPHWAKRGVLSDHIPLALIAGKKKGNFQQPLHQDEPVLRWVSGRLEVPEACGNGFKYSIQDFAKFSNVDHDVSDIEQALSVYVDTILFGLVAAIDIHKKLESGEVPSAVPGSGQSLMIGHVKLNLHLCASPIQGASVTSEDGNLTDSWAVSQGDLFRGELDVSEVLNKSGALFVNFRDSNRKKESCHVIVKVSSTTVHGLHIPPDKAFDALTTISRAGKSLAIEIGSVLHAAAEMRAGVLTIMDDMTEQGYGSLRPVEDCDQIAVLWDGFQDLVENALLPMAELGIVHADIRPGYDITSNILCKLETSKDTGVKKATMKLIDFESLVHFKRWYPGYLDGRYVRKEDGWDATTYVWWQCMAVAYAWKETLNADSLRIDRPLAKMKIALLYNSRGVPVWLDQFRDRAKGVINATTVKMTLKELAKEMVMTSQRASRSVLSDAKK